MTALEPAGRCAVTGAGGYLGSHLSTWFRRHGWSVCELRHRADAGADDLVRPYSLEDHPRPDDFLGIAALVHCAHDFRWKEWRDIERVNVQGSVRLFEAARAAGVRRLVFVSTLSAFDGCRSHYGRAKIAVEEAVVQMGGVVVRPGLVWGGATGGMVGSLQRSISQASIMPLIGGRQIFYLVHIDDVCGVIDAICRQAPRDSVAGPVVAAAEGGMPFGDILRSLAGAAGRRVRLVPVPWRLAWLGLRSAEALGLRLAFRSDSVLGLVHTGPPPDFSAARAYGVAFRPFVPVVLP